MKALILLTCSMAAALAQGSSIVADGTLSATLTDEGLIQSMVWARPGTKPVNLAFRQDQFAGFSWHVNIGGQWHVKLPLKRDRPGANEFATVMDGVTYSMAYAVKEGHLEVVAGIRNDSGKVCAPERALVNFGMDEEMAKFPEWNERFFPTLLRCEKTHFWGYFMRPDGVILAAASPDPVVSWAHGYNGGGHRIRTSCLDLLNTAPQPERHPKVPQTLGPGESRRWRILLIPMDKLADVQLVLARAAGIPMIGLERPTVEPGQAVKGSLFTSAPTASLKVSGPDGSAVPHDRAGSGFSFRPAAPGIYTITLETGEGKIAEATAALRMPWSWYAKQARVNAVAKPQKAGSHTESWYGFFSGYIARRYFPDPALDSAIEAKYAELAPLVYDTEKMQPSSWQNRIQNHACWASMEVARYRATGNIRALEFAASLADFLATKQSDDGAYRNGRTHYTCVVYIAKSIMEVMAAERPLAAGDAAWKARFERHSASVGRAVDELARKLDDIDTEGEATYEDGMIACEYSQLAMYALLQGDPATRRRYLDAAQAVAAGHRCLSQILIPDCRMNGGSLRYWESQYDIMTSPDMMCSPHGWSAFRLYGLWYLYQLTGEKEYLRQAMNGLSSCVQLIDFKTGDLRWAFVPDPCVHATVFEKNPDGTPPGRFVNRVIGEQYMPMISDWYRAKPNTFVNGYLGMDSGRQTGGSCDNDVHEIFKCLGEIALTSAYVVENADGTLETWNCTAVRDGTTIRVTPAESVVCRVHFNLGKPAAVAVEFSSGRTSGQVSGLTWFGPGGVPEELR